MRETEIRDGVASVVFEAQARQANLQDRVAFDLGSASELPYPGGAFDEVQFFESPCHFPDRDLTFRVAILSHSISPDEPLIHFFGDCLMSMKDRSRMYELVSSVARALDIGPIVTKPDRPYRPRLEVLEDRLAPAVYTNTTPFDVPAIGSPNDKGNADPNYSFIQVSGENPTGCVVRVSLVNISHTYPADISIILVAPDWTEIDLLAGALGTDEIYNVTLTFDDSALDPIDAFDAEVFDGPGTFRPSEALSAFNNINPNGTWELWVRDTMADNTGTIAGGWALEILPPPTPPNQAPTDISLSDSTVIETATIGTLVGELSTTDPDVGDTFSYSLVAGDGSTDNACFQISNDQLQTGPGFFFKREAYSVRIRTTDAYGLFHEEVFTITGQSVLTASQRLAEIVDLFPTKNLESFYLEAQTWVNTGTADERYVQALYQRILFRSAEPTELAEMVALLSKYSLKKVATEVFHSEGPLVQYLAF